MASFVGNCTVNGPGQSKSSVNPARSNKITARDKSGSSLAVSRIFGVHPAPSVGPSKSNASQIDAGAADGRIPTGGTSGAAAGGETGALSGAAVGSTGSVGGGATGRLTGVLFGAFVGSTGSEGGGTTTGEAIAVRERKKGC
jgi:hypothetical protein